MGLHKFDKQAESVQKTLDLSCVSILFCNIFFYFFELQIQQSSNVWLDMSLWDNQLHLIVQVFAS